MPTTEIKPLSGSDNRDVSAAHVLEASEFLVAQIIKKIVDEYDGDTAAFFNAVCPPPPPADRAVEIRQSRIAQKFAKSA